MSGKPARRGVQHAALAGLPGSALSSLVPPKPEATTSTHDVLEASGASDVSLDGALPRHPQRSKRPVRRDPTKVDAELLQQMRDLTAFIRGKGRPMAELGELLDEALSGYLDRRRDELNEGQAFPYVGRLR